MTFRAFCSAQICCCIARQENTGSVLLGSDDGGSAGYHHRCLRLCLAYQGREFGVALPSPFQQEALDAAIATALSNREQQREWQHNALRYAARTPMQGLVEEAVRCIEATA